MFAFALLTLSAVATAVVAAPSGFNATVSRRAATVYGACTTPNTVALTFDDGPYIWTSDIVNQLNQAGAKGTFFFNGDNYDCIYNVDERNRVRSAYDQGHMVASHTWAHKDLATLSRAQIDDEMARTDLAIQRITGALPAFMRPPYGSYNQDVLDAAGARGQGVVMWDFEDSAGATAAESIAAYEAIANAHPNTILTLNHETYESTVHQVLPGAISRLKSAGYRLVTVAECLGLPAYQSVGAPGTPDGSWTC